MNVKVKKTIIAIIVILAVAAIAATGIFVFTKGSDDAEAMVDNETTIRVEEDGSKVAVDTAGNVVGTVDEEGNITPIENTTTNETTIVANNNRSTSSATTMQERVVEDKEIIKEETGIDGKYLSWEQEELSFIPPKTEINYYATFVTGQEFWRKAKAISRKIPNSTNSSNTIQNIYYIKRANSIEDKYKTDNYKVSIDDRSNTPIYIWGEDDGTLYWYNDKAQI